MEKWYRRVIKKIGMHLFFHGSSLAQYVNAQAYGEGKTKVIRIQVTDIWTNKDCVIEVKICE